MTAPPKYVLDANVFMEAARRYYAFDLVPAFWQALIDNAQKGRLLSIDRVRDEVSYPDELAKWSKGSFHPWFVSTGEAEILQAYRQIMRWAQAQSQYSNGAKAEFADERNADAWLIAYAQARGAVVVTHEVPDSKIKKKIPIPNVCKAFSVPFIDSFAMLRALGVKLG
ncbi:MAG TPA: DUF4411 family protein [Candidatus Binataceae bacterium]|nr:DUF4411 family protein [Candidatus Binataceae bacterium]